MSDLSARVSALLARLDALPAAPIARDAAPVVREMAAEIERLREALTAYVEVLAEGPAGGKTNFMSAIRMADDNARAALLPAARWVAHNKQRDRPVS